MQRIEDEYLDVLQNIEYAIVSVYREHDVLLDYEVDKVLDALIRVYKTEGSSRPATLPKMSEVADQLYRRVKTMCDWRMGCENIQSEIPQPPPITTEEAIACIKRIRKSIKLWTKEGGRQGYLQFISEHVI